MDKRIKILVNTPDIEKQGGVANYYKGLKGKFNEEVRYNYIGGSSKSRFAVLYLFRDYLIFMWKLIFFRPDIVHLNPSLDKKAVLRDAVFLLMARTLGRKVIVSWHGWNLNVQDKIEYKFKRIFVGIFNKAHAFTVLCSDFKEKMTQWGITKPVYLETTLFDDSLLDDFKYKDKKHGKRILFLSRIEKEKGIYQALNAFDYLDQNIYSITIAGAGKELEKVRNFVVKNNIKNVHFTGYITGREKVEALKSHDVNILLSESEGMPLSTLEAMAFGLVIITTPVGGVKDFFEDGKMGYFTDSNNFKAISDLFIKVFSDESGLKEISKYNYEYAQKNFKASSVAKRLETIYQSIIAPAEN